MHTDSGAQQATGGSCQLFAQLDSSRSETVRGTARRGLPLATEQWLKHDLFLLLYF